VTLHIQFISLVWMLGSGIVLGIAFDVYRVLQLKLHIRGWLISLFDLLYWIGATLFVFYVLLSSNDGQLRFYIFAALCLGLWIYFTKWSSLVIQIVLWLVQVFELVMKWILILFRALIIRPLQLLIYIGAWIGHIGMSFFYFIIKCIYILLSPLGVLLRPFRSLLHWLWKPIAKRIQPYVKSVTLVYQRILSWFKS
jgi:spore cortex biosynthesis protein YabQ